HPYVTALNTRKLLDTHRLLGDRPLPRSLARSLLTIPKHDTLDGWLASLPERASDPDRARRLVEGLHESLGSERQTSAVSKTSEVSGGVRPPRALTFAHTPRRGFEVAYWKTIAALAAGDYQTKNNADCIRDPITSLRLPYIRRDLDALGDFLLDHYRQ